jgi:hypothetical protein
VAAVNAVADEQHLTGQVGVVGARGGAGLHHRKPVIAVGKAYPPALSALPRTRSWPFSMPTAAGTSGSPPPGTVTRSPWSFPQASSWNW